MNIESMPSKKNPALPMNEEMMDDFDFKPITSGLGFHHSKPTDNKPVVNFNSPAPTPLSNSAAMNSFPKKENAVYQNDLAIFYGQQVVSPAPVLEEVSEKVYRLASKSHRVLAYVIDLMLVSSFVAIVLTLMARTISMDLMEVWSSYPNEITPLVVILFMGFYLIYFSIFEKSSTSTLGKNILGLKVVNLNNELQSFSALMIRTFIGLLNFASLGLFSYFDLQNKVTGSKVIRND